MFRRPLPELGVCRLAQAKDDSFPFEPIKNLNK